MTPASEYESKHVRSLPLVVRGRFPDPPLGYVLAAHGQPWGQLLNMGHGIPSEWRKKLREAGKLE